MPRPLLLDRCIKLVKPWRDDESESEEEEEGGEEGPEGEAAGGPPLARQVAELSLDRQLLRELVAAGGWAGAVLWVVVLVCVCVCVCADASGTAAGRLWLVGAWPAAAACARIHLPARLPGSLPVPHASLPACPAPPPACLIALPACLSVRLPACVCVNLQGPRA